MRSLFVAACVALFAGGFASDFRGFEPYDPAVPTPSSLLGYETGTRHTVYFDQDRVVNAIAAAAPERVKRIDFGKSTEGRPLRIFAVSSPENMRRLEEIRTDHLSLANPDAKGNYDERVKVSPGIVWINECIHGDETASFESAMELLYTLAASRSATVERLLANTVVIVNPSYNPDGHERYVVAYNTLPGGSQRGAFDRAIPSAFFGRANHYRFDMNRDRIAMSQVETQQEVKEFLRWNPQVYVDQHGQVETYFFPPVQQSVNVNVDRGRYNHWSDVFGRATAASFDAKGWTYFVRDSFDFYNACYLDTHTTLMGAIGLTHETDGGRVLKSVRSDGTILTMRDGAVKHFTSAMAVIASASEHKDELLRSFVEYKKDAVSGKFAGKFRRVVLEGDSRELRRFAEHLSRSGIESQFALLPWKQKRAHSYWSQEVGDREFLAGALVVDMAQSQGPLAKALLEPFSDFEPEFVKRQKEKAKHDATGEGQPELDSFEFYDTTAWCLPYAYNLKAWWCESDEALPVPKVLTSSQSFPMSTVGYAIDYSDETDLLLAVDALMAGLKVSMTTKRIVAGGETYETPTFMILAARNEPGYRTVLLELAAKRGVSVRSMKTSYPDEGRHGPGSESMVQLVAPKIGVSFGDAGQLNGGALWYTMEKVFRLPFEALSDSALSGDLDSYTCLVCPEGTGTMTESLKTWVRAGGTLVVFGSGNWATGDTGFMKVEDKTGQTDLPGAIFKASIDSASYIGFGYPTNSAGTKDVALPVDGSRFVKAGDDSVIKFSDDEKVQKLLSGWAWDETEQEMAGTAWASAKRYGQGSVVIFHHDPVFRAQWPGLHKMILNAMFLGVTR